jgi:diguanylate cyclase (GGDEF)-like protein
MLVHLDRLKRINDLLGSAVGDHFLRRTCERLRVHARGRDVVGRLAGDEFLMVCEDVVSEEQAVAIAERVGGALREIIETSTLRIEPTVSIGVAWTTGGTNAEGLIAAADAAIDAKAGGSS